MTLSLDDLGTEAKRIAEWIEKNSEDPIDSIEPFIFNLLINSKIDFYEVLGLLEHMKLELHRQINQKIEEENAI